MHYDNDVNDSGDNVGLLSYHRVVNYGPRWLSRQYLLRTLYKHNVDNKTI